MPDRYWLVKSEAGVYSIDDLERDGKTLWDGIRNYQARNNIREMKVGDGVLFYHSQQQPPAVVGRAKVARTAYPDPTQFDRKSKYYDPDSDEDDPSWWVVDIAFAEKFPTQVALAEVKADGALAEMVLAKNSRLSVQPVRAEEWQRVLQMAGSKAT